MRLATWPSASILKEKTITFYRCILMQMHRYHIKIDDFLD